MRKSLVGIVPILLILGQLACNLPSGVSTATPVPSDTPTPAASATLIILTQNPTITSTPLPQDPLVLRATLCWQGPGPAYPTVSALKVNERVKLLGRGSISGWYIVENPIYHDPCWVQESELQIEPGTDLAGLRIFNPPPTSTPTKPPPTITPSPTP
jgi:hypothetical protein